MEEVIREGQVNLTEKKWEVISNRLAARYGFTRSKTSIKNYWNRQGRAQTGVDERRKPNPDKLVTSVSKPEQRKRARTQVSRASNQESTEDHEDEEDEDDGDQGNDGDHENDHSGHPEEEGKEQRNEGEEVGDDDEGGPPTKRRRRR